MYIMPTWNAKCPIFLGNKLPLKPATIALKIGHLAFQENISSPPPKKKISTQHNQPQGPLIDHCSSVFSLLASNESTPRRTTATSTSLPIQDDEGTGLTARVETPLKGKLFLPRKKIGVKNTRNSYTYEYYVYIIYYM